MMIHHSVIPRKEFVVTCDHVKKRKISHIGQVIINQDNTIFLLAFCFSVSSHQKQKKMTVILEICFKSRQHLHALPQCKICNPQLTQGQGGCRDCQDTPPCIPVLRKNVCLHLSQNTEMIPPVQGKLRRGNISCLNRQPTEQHHHFLSYFSHRMKMQTGVDFLQGNLHSLALQIQISESNVPPSLV